MFLNEYRFSVFVIYLLRKKKNKFTVLLKTMKTDEQKLLTSLRTI